MSRAAAQAADALAVGMSWELGSASTMHYLSAQAVSTGREHYLSAPERYRLASDHRWGRLEGTEHSQTNLRHWGTD